MSEIITAIEQKSVFTDLKSWLEEILGTDIQVTISNLGVDNALAIVPSKGIRKSKQYACGGYEVYLPFSIYYRVIADDDDTISECLNLLDLIGDRLEKNGTEGIPELKLTEGRELLEAYQEFSSIKCGSAGKVADFTASYILIYSKEE